MGRWNSTRHDRPEASTSASKFVLSRTTGADEEVGDGAGVGTGVGAAVGEEDEPPQAEVRIAPRIVAASPRVVTRHPPRKGD